MSAAMLSASVAGAGLKAGPAALSSQQPRVSRTTTASSLRAFRPHRRQVLTVAAAGASGPNEQSHPSNSSPFEFGKAAITGKWDPKAVLGIALPLSIQKLVAGYEHEYGGGGGANGSGGGGGDGGGDGSSWGPVLPEVAAADDLDDEDDDDYMDDDEDSDKDTSRGK
eukprot:scaffold81859_cov29-Prasinocladus_malaysianus.AAC.5